jgi:hypothetical protein
MLLEGVVHPYPATVIPIVRPSQNLVSGAIVFIAVVDIPKKIACRQEVRHVCHYLSS